MADHNHRNPHPTAAQHTKSPLLRRGRPHMTLDTRAGSPLGVESECGAVAVGRTYLLPPLSSGGASLVRPWLRFHTHRVGRGSHPPPPPTDRSVRISRTTLFGRWFTALREPAAPDRATAAGVGAVGPAL